MKLAFYCMIHLAIFSAGSAAFADGAIDDPLPNPKEELRMVDENRSAPDPTGDLCRNGADGKVVDIYSRARLRLSASYICYYTYQGKDVEPVRYDATVTSCSEGQVKVDVILFYNCRDQS